MSIDLSLYDRQVRTYGIEALTKINASSVLIYGLAGGLGTEVAKNLALGGIKTIYLYDDATDNLVTKNDLETGYYYNEEEINQVRANILAPKIQELNPYIQVIPVSTYHNNQKVSILINQPTNFVEEFSNYSRNYIVLYSRGISGVIFVDAGVSHFISDLTGEVIDPVQIGSIDKNGLVKCAQYAKHDYQSGDTITFENLQGTNLDWLKKNWTINVIDPVSFQITNWSCPNEDWFFINATSIYIRPTKTIYHQTWAEQVSNPSINFSFDMNLSEKMIQTYLTLFANNLVLLKNLDKVGMDKSYLYEIAPVVSFMGSMVASEAIKLITNKYVPINQWFTWTDTTLAKHLTEGTNNNAYAKLFGDEFYQKLTNSEWFMVGSGAIGCEHLKNLLLMDVKKVTITDPDIIEKSNLNRQFLFRSEHIKSSKALIAGKMIKQMRPNSRLEIETFMEKMGPENQSFADKIMKSGITGVLNALDNIKARRYMDDQCFKNNKPLFESGTTGTKGNTQTVIPFITETYSASNDPVDEKSFPICVIKSFPNEIAHTIFWAMDNFEFFNRGPTNMNNWLSNESYLESLNPIERAQAEEDIEWFTTKYPMNDHKDLLKNMVKASIDLFVQNYHNTILDILETFKPDLESSPGIPFWSGGKRCPKPIKFNPNDETHLDFVEATTNLLINSCGYDYLISRDTIKEWALGYNHEEYQGINQSSETKTTKDRILGSKELFNKNQFVSQEFEKDDDTNWHVSFVTAASNLRAMNYGIQIADRQQTKGIAGKIIPAIATTTSAVCGLVMIEVMKYLMNCNKVEDYRSNYLNLAEPSVLYSEPVEASMIDVASVKLNAWTKFNYKCQGTMKELKEYYEQMFKTTITMIVLGKSIMYSDFAGSDDLDNDLLSMIKKTLDVEELPNTIYITLASENESINIPEIEIIN